MPVISDQDTGKSHTFEKPLNKVYNHGIEIEMSHFIRLGNGWCVFRPVPMRTMESHLISVLTEIECFLQGRTK